MRPARSTLVLIAVLLANAAALLSFRYFITVDGPVHVLRASLLETPWNSVEHAAHGITYDAKGIGKSLGDRILNVLLVFRSPEQAHDLYAALVLCAVVLSAVAFSRVHGTRMGLASLWLAPLSLHVVVFMGLFHFLLGSAIAFASAAWWKWREQDPLWRWTGLLVGVVLAWYTHRGAMVILCMLLVPGLVVGLRAQGGPFHRVDRRYRPWLLGFMVMLLVMGTWRLWPAMRSNAQHIVSGTPLPQEANPLRPLFLLDPHEEQWIQGGIGVLLVVSFVAAIRVRWHMGRKWLWHDTLLAGLFFLALLASFHRVLAVPELHIAERCRWLVFLFVAIWLAAIAGAHGGWTARVIGGAALCALPLHVVRLVRAEAALSRLLPVHLAAMEAAGALGPRSVVWPVITEPDRLLQHLEAFAAIRHKGILIAPGEHVHLVVPFKLWLHAGWLYTEDPAWLVRHWRKGIPPEVDQVLFMGKGIEQAVSKHPWPKLLGDRFRLSFDNGYARIYTAAKDSTMGSTQP